MRLLLLALPLLLLSTGCDSSGPDRGDEYQVRAVSAELLAVVPNQRTGSSPDARRVSFAFQGEIPLVCETTSVNSYGYSTGSDRPGRIDIDISVFRDREGDVCTDGIGTVEVVPLDINVEGPGTYTFAFARLGGEPLEVTLDID